jgi:hypothetical protein
VESITIGIVAVARRAGSAVFPLKATMTSTFSATKAAAFAAARARSP